MLEKEELSYIENQIKEATSSISRTHNQWIVDKNYNDYYREEYPGWTKEWIKSRLRDLYSMILVYLEGKGLVQYIQTFKDKFGLMIEDEENILKSISLHPEGEEELYILDSFRRFLEPFKSFNYRQKQENELLKLTPILHNTGFIIENSKAGISNESDIYKQVKWVLELYYPSVRRKNRASFIQQFKTYEPDILIPELKTAIEYKYLAKASGNMDEYLDQLKVDSTNYVSDYRYEIFFAVIYIENIAIATPESIEVAWNSKQFPRNWKLVVAGHSVSNKATSVE